ncbi:MAG TPA: flagellin [Candidatus Anaerobiospirillum stercoravium]|nr:flagellin [Candidatus Anaerobiospirillum stercoravium]
MSLFINTNISSLTAQRAAQRANDKLDAIFERLASGQRINSAKDDAAGIQVANNLTTQLNGLNQGNRNAQDAIAFAQTVEGALDEVTNMLQRIRTLAIQAATATTTDTDRGSIQAEVDQLTDEICRISNETTFGGADILNGNASIVRFQCGPDPSSIIEFDLSSHYDVTGIAALAADFLPSITLTAATDIDGTHYLSGSKIEGYIKGADGKYYAFEDLFHNRGAKSGISLTSAENAELVLGGIDYMIQAIDSTRANLGAMQNRLEATVRNQDSIKENVMDSRSRIQDTDFADDTANLTQQQIIQQATATILTQANQRPQIALSLISGN